jgi:hypothetical protein
MSDDFGTINLQRGERAREIEVLRQHYRKHREALARMTADAPTESLAAEYQRLIVEIDRSLGKLNELEGGPGATTPPPPPPRPPDRLKTEPGLRPLVTAPATEDAEPGASYEELPPAEDAPRSRVPLLLGITVVALALIGWLVWKASSDGKPAATTTTPIVEETAGATSTLPDTAVEETTDPPVTGAALSVTPRSHDYGTIRKGTRATRQFEITNTTDQPITIAVARSTCRCLYYEHAPVVPPKAKESLTVTIDGARAKAGDLRESIRVGAKNDPATGTTVDVIATIR